MTMVSEALQLFRQRAAEGEVAADVQAKVHQLAADIESRNFHGASAVQAVSHVARAIFAIDT